MTTTTARCAKPERRHQVLVDYADEGDMEFALFGVRGIFNALWWIHEGMLDERIPEERIREARDDLLLAGRTLAEMTLARV